MFFKKKKEPQKVWVVVDGVHKVCQGVYTRMEDALARDYEISRAYAYKGEKETCITHEVEIDKGLTQGPKR